MDVTTVTRVGGAYGGKWNGVLWDPNNKKKKRQSVSTQERAAPKRSRLQFTTTDSDTESSDDDFPFNKQNWPKFIWTTSAASASFRLSPLQRQSRASPENLRVFKKLSSGHLLIECERRQHAENLLKCTKVVEIPVLASQHKTMNSSKEVVRSRDLDGTDETEMASKTLNAADRRSEHTSSALKFL